MRGADPAIVLVPGVGMWSFGADSQTARVAGEFYVNAINVMRGAEALSSYVPIPDSEKFRVEYWELEERKLRLRPPSPPLTGRIAFVTGAASGIGLAIAKRLHGLGAAVVLADLDEEAARREAEALADPDRVLAVAVDVSRGASPSRRRWTRPCSASAASTSSSTTPVSRAPRRCWRRRPPTTTGSTP